jgi:ribosome biogenesis GTPase A
VDYFDFDGTVVPDISKYIGGLPMLVVLNKCDLWPDGVHDARVRTWVRTQLKDMGVQHVLGVRCVSAVSMRGIRDVLQDIQVRCCWCYCYCRCHWLLLLLLLPSFVPQGATRAYLCLGERRGPYDA